jgi:hypothetical protein
MAQEDHALFYASFLQHREVSNIFLIITGFLYIFDPINLIKLNSIVNGNITSLSGCLLIRKKGGLL